MKTTKYVLAAFIGLIGLVAPSAVWADNIVNVTVSNVIYNGNNACPPPSGTALCTQTLNMAFQWDNTTNTIVAGSQSFNTSGALGSSGFVFTIPSLVFGLPTVAIGVGAGPGPGFQPPYLGIDIGETANFQFATGTYSLLGRNVGPQLAPGTWTGGVLCPATGTCQNMFVGAFARGAIASSGTLTVSPVPEPPALLLLGTGLVGLVGAMRRKWLA